MSQRHLILTGYGFNSGRQYTAAFAGKRNKKGLAKMVDEVAANMKNTQEKILAISHCNCEERAKAVRDMLLERASFKDVIILDTAGISSMYAADGGVIVVCIIFIRYDRMNTLIGKGAKTMTRLK